MYPSHTITVQIDRPLDEVYDFLSDPTNLGRWATVPGGGFSHVGGLDWRADTPSGPVVIRYTERNRHGVMDHTVFRAGEAPVRIPMRVFANGEGSELTYTIFRRPGMSAEAFASEAEWVATELAVAKSVLEARNNP